MTSPSIRERIVDSIAETLAQIGKDPNDDYWFEYAVHRYAITGEEPTPPSIRITTLSGGSELETNDHLNEALQLEFLVKVAHNLRKDPGLPPETETDRLIERATSDVQRAVVRWIYIDPLGISPVLESISWDREDPLEGRLESGVRLFVTLTYNHSAIDPRTQVFDPAELV